MVSTQRPHETKQLLRAAQQTINPKYVQSLFVAGSRPTQLTKQQDIDIFTITKHKYTENILEQLDETFAKTLNKTATHSFIDGPIKYQHKGLVHLLVYTDNKNHPASIYNVPNPILHSWVNTSETLVGDDLENILNTTALITKENLQASIQSMERRKKQVQKNYFRPKQWIKKTQGWNYQRKQVHLSKFRKEYLQNYFDRHINETKELLLNT